MMSIFSGDAAVSIQAENRTADTLLVKPFDMEVLPAADLSKKVERFGKQSAEISLLLHNFLL
ncbi:hypothetical protein [Lysinibacillus sp. 3P01SB]|uniref:hypothetical protein n=1 Tax=Lysinibacillus sp. 3P01SB TaxID=3132284 RepID=UPI0039A45C4D